MRVGYCRTSTIQQMAGLDSQLRDLESAGCEKIFQEQVSCIAEREQLEAALRFVRVGDVFVVTKLDRLARSVADLLRISQELEEKSVILNILNISIDTSTPTGRLLLTLLGAVAQFEREIMLERQREGIARAKAQGKYKGRNPMEKEIFEEILRLSETRISRKKLAKRFGVGVSTVYRILNTKKQSV